MSTLLGANSRKWLCPILHTDLRKQGGHINFWKKCLSNLVRDNSPSVLKIPLARKWPINAKRVSPHNYLILPAVGRRQRLNSDLVEILVWFNMSILVYCCESSALKITWPFKPRNISSIFRDVCTIALRLCFLIAPVSQSSVRPLEILHVEIKHLKNTIPCKAER